MKRRFKITVKACLACGVFVCLFLVALSFALGQYCKPLIVNRGRAAVGENGTITQGIRMYEYDLGKLPESLDELFTPPTDPELQKKWTHYLDDRSVLKDPWGHDVRYLGGAKAIHNRGRFDLWSVGPDGVDGTADDISNWKIEPVGPS
ncbi:MAG: type II secretion system protein GspG [Planctomycetota bacterium]